MIQTAAESHTQAAEFPQAEGGVVCVVRDATTLSVVDAETPHTKAPGNWDAFQKEKRSPRRPHSTCVTAGGCARRSSRGFP